MARYFLDTEFDGHEGPLLSLALVREDGLSLYIRTNEQPRDEWVIDNVMNVIDDHQATQSFQLDLLDVGGMVRAFLGPDPFEIVSDSPVDVKEFCKVFSTSREGGWQSTGYDSITFTVINVDSYPTELKGARQHNAWWDAMALREKILNG